MEAKDLNNMNKAEELNKKEEKVLIELDELKHIGGWHKNRIAILKEYATEVSRGFAKYLDKINKNVSTYPYGSFEGLYNEWKSNQEKQ